MSPAARKPSATAAKTSKPKTTPAKPTKPANASDPAALGMLLHKTVSVSSRLSPNAVARAKELLEKGADPDHQAADANQTTVLFQLSFVPNQELALEVLDAMLARRPALRARPDKLGRWPLHVALWYGRTTAYWDKLLTLGCPIAAVDSRGITPMFDAIKRDNHKAIEWLLANGATLDGALAFAKEPKNHCSDKTIRFLEKLLAK